MKRVNFYYLMVKIFMYSGLSTIVIGAFTSLTIMYIGITTTWFLFFWLALAWEERIKIMNRKLNNEN